MVGGWGGTRIVEKVLFSLQMQNRLLEECLLSDRIMRRALSLESTGWNLEPVLQLCYF